MEIATQVKEVYWQLCYLFSKQRLLKYQDSLFSGFLRAAELRARTGETNRLEMTTARSQSLDVKNQLQQTTADIGIYRRRLQTILNTTRSFYPSDTVLRRSGFIMAGDSAPVAGNPTLGYMHQQVEVSRMEKKLEGSKAMPDFTLGYFSQTMQGVQEVDGAARSFGPGDRFTGFQAEIAIPLWFGPYIAKTRSARLREQVAGIHAEYYSKSLTGSYRSLLDEYRKYSISIEYYEKQAVPEADMIIDQANRSYKAGALDYLEYILSLNRALGIKQNYLDALNEYNQTIISIELITGKI
jgi:cobalt-zinc-cadmium resistance protein CzcA